VGAGSLPSVTVSEFSIMALSTASGSTPFRVGLWLLIVATALGLIDAIFQYFWTGNGIHGTEGVLLVIVSTLLQLIAALVFLAGVRGWVRTVLEVLVFLDLIGTAAAAYLLEDYILLGLTILAAIGWLLQLGGRSRRPALQGAAS
jgi:hypothetical protein